MRKEQKFLTGFTLMELVVASAILVVALVGLIAVFVGSFTLSEGARNLTIATNDAQTVMEEIRDYNIPSLITAEDWTVWAQADISQGGGGCNSLNNESIQVTYPSGQSANPLEIMVTVNWTERERPKSTQLVTLLTSR